MSTYSNHQYTSIERAIVLDTETTGFDPSTGDRLVEIGCIEIVNHVPTGREYHQYINPEREVPIEAEKVHGLKYQFLKDFPTFGLVASQFLEFVGDAPLVIHNAKFDMRFLNAELKSIGLPIIKFERAICTLEIAKRKFPGARVSLDELCKRFKIDATNRTLHGALLDANLLAKVYLELMGGRQTGLNLTGLSTAADSHALNNSATGPVYTPRQFDVAKSAEERQLHDQLLKKIKDPLWHKTLAH